MLASPSDLPRDQWQCLQDAVYENACTSSFEHLPMIKTSYIRGWELMISSQDDGFKYVYEEDGSVTKLCLIQQTILAGRDGFTTCFKKTIELEKLNYFPPLDTDQNMASAKSAGEQADSVPPSVEELGIPLELAEQAEQDEQDFDEEQTVSPAPETDQQADLVPPSVEELGTPLELAEQAIEEEHVSPASEPCLNMALPNFAGEQADSVPPSVDQLGTLPAPKIRPCHVPDSATHMTPAKSPADVVPSAVLIMDFRNLQYRRHVKHLVDHTDVASMGGNTNTSAYAYSG